MPLILLLTMIAIFFYYNAQENIKGFYKTRGFQGKVQITGIGWADKITYRMNKEDEVKHYLIFHIDYQETINNKKEHVKTQLPLHIQDLLYPYIASPTESDSDFNRQNSEYKILPDEREYGDDFVKKSIKINPRNQKFINDISKGPHAQQVIFLSADAFGVLPPVSILNPEQAQYYFLSGFTAKLAGTERGITEPTPTFSACFGAAFLSLHPTKYAEELVKKMEKTGAKAYLVNTGWNGTGKRISIRDTRGIIDAILDGSIDKAPTKVIPYFDFVVPTELPGVDPKILDPRDTYADAAQWDEKAKDLAGRFIKNFAKFTGNEAGKKLVAAGPKL